MTQRQGRLTDRWPTALGIVTAAFAIVLVVLVDDDAAIFGPSVAVMAGIYLLAYVVGRPWTAWVAFAVLSAVMSVLQTLHRLDVAWADPFVGIVVVVVLLWLLSLARRRYTDLDTFSVQTAGMVVFGVLTLACAAVAPRLGAAVAGVGFLAHGLWDAYHYRIDRVVHRSWSEYCAVIDIPTGTALIIAALA